MKQILMAEWKITSRSITYNNDDDAMSSFFKADYSHLSRIDQQQKQKQKLFRNNKLIRKIKSKKTNYHHDCRSAKQQSQSRSQFARLANITIGARQHQHHNQKYQHQNKRDNPETMLTNASITINTNGGSGGGGGSSSSEANNNYNHDDEIDQMTSIKKSSQFHIWHWDENNKSDECFVSRDKLDVCFHPECSESAAAIRGSIPLQRDGNYYYWEVTVFNKVYGTSVMFGLCTKDQKMHLDDYRNLIGLDQNGWSLSHKGFIWHNNKSSQYTQIFPAEQSVTIGMLFDSLRGTLSYFKDGKNLGVAFYGLNDIDEDLYPAIGSTAKCTRMRLEGSYCGIMSLKERCSFVLMKNARDRVQLLNEMMTVHRVPKHLVVHLARAALACSNQAAINQQRSLPEELRELVIDYDEIASGTSSIPIASSIRRHDIGAILQNSIKNSKSESTIHRQINSQRIY